MTKEFYSLEQIQQWYGSKENILRLTAEGSLPDPYWASEDIDDDIACRLRRREDLPAVIEEKRSIFRVSEPLED